MGLEPADAASAAAWFEQMEPGFAVAHCRGDWLAGPTRHAVFGGDGSGSSFRVAPFEAVPSEKLPRLVLLSGMTTQEVVAVAEHWLMFTGTREPVFVSLLPGMLDRPLADIVLEATRAAASARAPGEEGPRLDGEMLKDAIRRKVEERRAGKGRGPVTLSLVPGGGAAVWDAPSAPAEALPAVEEEGRVGRLRGRARRPAAQGFGQGTGAGGG